MCVRTHTWRVVVHLIASLVQVLLLVYLMAKRALAAAAQWVKAVADQDGGNRRPSTKVTPAETSNGANFIEIKGAAKLEADDDGRNKAEQSDDNCGEVFEIKGVAELEASGDGRNDFCGPTKPTTPLILL